MNLINYLHHLPLLLLLLLLLFLLHILLPTGVLNKKSVILYQLELVTLHIHLLHHQLIRCQYHHQVVYFIAIIIHLINQLVFPILPLPMNLTFWPHFHILIQLLLLQCTQWKYPMARVQHFDLHLLFHRKRPLFGQRPLILLVFMASQHLSLVLLVRVIHLVHHSVILMDQCQVDLFHHHQVSLIGCQW